MSSWDEYAPQPLPPALKREHRSKGQPVYPTHPQIQEVDEKTGTPARDVRQALMDKVHPFASVMSDQPPPSRLSVNLIFSCQPSGRQAKGGDVRGQRLLESGDAEHTDRTYDMEEGVEYPFLSGSWVPDPGNVIVDNLTGTGLARRPSEAEAQRLLSVVIEIRRPGQDLPLAEVLRGTPFLGRVPRPEECYMVAVGGDAKVNVIVFPK